MILCIETATSVCSAALCEAGRVVSVRESGDKRSHATELTVFISELLQNAGISAKDLRAVAVSKGPGSYTGLRIGVAAAKGIAYGSDIPLIGIDTSESMFYGLTSANPGLINSAEDVYFCPMLDARRMEVYYSIFDKIGNIIKGIAAEVIDVNSFSFIPGNTRVIFFGEGAIKCEAVLSKSNFEFIHNFSASAGNMRIPAFRAFTEKKFENIAYFEPYYLKDFVATVPKKNILS